jgi:hypothetical protein
MRDDIIATFPEIEQISNADLREKVIAVWADALQTGGWTMQELRAIPFTLLAGDIDMRFLEHVRTCVRMSLAIYDVLSNAYGDRVPLDRDTLLAGSLLADVGKPIEYVKGADGKPGQGDARRHAPSPLQWSRHVLEARPAGCGHAHGRHAQQGRRSRTAHAREHHFPSR